MSVSGFIKGYLPAWLLDARRALYRKRLFKPNQTKELKDIFTETYKTARWGTRPGVPFWSGEGSGPEQATDYEVYLSNFLKSHPDVTTFVDIGCGDFQVSKRVLASLKTRINYIGVDIVPDLIVYNNEKYGSDTTAFICADATKDYLPAGNLVAVRQVLQHLSNENASKVIRKVSDTPYLLITEDIPQDPCASKNADIVNGHWSRSVAKSGIYVDAPPFNLDAIEVVRVPLKNGRCLRTTLTVRT